MYGYVIVNKPELKFREYDVYRSYYCGLCSALKKKYGRVGQISLSYDMTFLTMLLSALYEPGTCLEKRRCIASPVIKHEFRTNVITDYVADMNLLMVYHKCQDDWLDEKKISRKVYSDIIAAAVRRVENKYPDKAKVIKNSLDMLLKAEKEDSANIDEVSSHFGRVMACLLTYRDDEWREELENIGLFLGRFIYLCDAYEDLEKDTRAGRYNVLKTFHRDEAFDDMIESILNSYMANVARSFERLPILENAEILRNIIYSGVWVRFQSVRTKKQEKKSDRSV